MLRIAVIAGSTRPHRRSRLVAEWVRREAEQVFARGSSGAGGEDAAAVAVEVVDLAEVDLPLLDEPVPAVFGQYRHEHTRHWSATVAGFDGFVFVVPEYNKSFPAALKNALDFLYAEWHGKAAGFVGYGVSGGQRAIEQLRLVCSELHLAHVGPQVELGLGADFDHDAPACAPGEGPREQLHAMVRDVAAWAGALRPLRVAGDTVPA